MLAGGSHHTALTTTVSSETIDDFARMLGVEHVAIDQSTTSKSIRQELAWSSAYHRLAARL
jgi:L-arabinose isomerase